jgi:ATP-dependent DNA ligase
MESIRYLFGVHCTLTDVFPLLQTSQLYREQGLLDQKPPYYRTLEQPDVWFSPHDVWEIRGADLTVSPVHASAVGLVHPTRGISMRFPRMIKVTAAVKWCRPFKYIMKVLNVERVFFHNLHFV